MLGMLEKLYQGAVGRFLRVALATAAGAAAAKYGQNEWFISATPLLNMIGKKLRDKWPGVWEWLPF